MAERKEKGVVLTAEQERDLIESLEANKDILPHLPALLEDLWELGSVPAKYVRMLKSLDLTWERTKVLDLGTGKGAVAVVLAQELGCFVLGVDLCLPFLEEARKRAETGGVNRICRFKQEDIHLTLKTARDFDLVLYISMGGLLGDFKECVGKLRKAVQPGGYMLIDDGFFKEGHHVEKKGYGHYASHRKTLTALEAHGDVLVREEIYSDRETSEINRGYMTAIKKRAAKVIRAHPETAESLGWYIQNQEEECLIIENDVTGACWLLQRKG